MADKSLSSYARYAIEGIGHVIENFGPRDPGSEGEKLAQEYVAQEMARYTNEVKCEEFTVHPRAFMGFMPVIGVLLIAAIALYWLGYALPSLVFTSLAVLVFPNPTTRRNIPSYRARTVCHAVQQFLG